MERAVKIPPAGEVRQRTYAGTRRRNGAGTALGGNGIKAKTEERMSKKLPEQPYYNGKVIFLFNNLRAPT